MLTLILIALAGAAANLVDGGIGMGFGVTSTTMLLLAGLGPAQASAVVHTAELGTTAISGLSHARFGNVDWKTVVRLGVPGRVREASTRARSSPVPSPGARWRERWEVWEASASARGTSTRWW